MTGQATYLVISVTMFAGWCFLVGAMLGRGWPIFWATAGVFVGALLAAWMWP